ncbi:zinc-dependent alcohol dehydrogenase [Lysinibacillus telephonicus]|uniref:Alcohol dehydrogenase n=1 Tax=Lysinibacillus telephonicus TaxID=1714840 RepID=A0A431UUG5_9BACI|nr:alcohol dehydrogenase catalytic domain-containing protein [Lysinibacillus telephonicus]RTQ94130.1 alcohol dehydrogenase [Lysinibacillus telephonicus]
MKVAEFDKIRSIVIKQGQPPKHSVGEVLVKTLLTGICGSEVHAYLGTHPFRLPPSVLGHEVIGEIISVGKGCKGLQEGDLVVIEPHYGCGKCFACENGDYNLCTEKTILGTVKWPGSFGEQFVAPAQCVYKIPKEFDSRYILVEPLAVGYHAVKKAEIQKGENVLIIGGGPIGILTGVAAKEAGAEKIYISDIAELNLKTVEDLNIGEAINSLKVDLEEYLKNQVIQHVFITVGITKGIEDACKLIVRKGKIISIALFEKSVPLDFNQVMIKEIQIFGSSMYTQDDFVNSINLVNSSKYPLEKIITKTYKFNDIHQAMEDCVLKSRETIKSVVDFTK